MYLYHFFMDKLTRIQTYKNKAKPQQYFNEIHYTKQSVLRDFHFLISLIIHRLIETNGTFDDKLIELCKSITHNVSEPYVGRSLAVSWYYGGITVTINYPEEKQYHLDYETDEREAGVWEDFLKHYKEVVTEVFVDYHRKRLDETITGLYAHQLSMWVVVEDSRSMGDVHPLLFLFDTENYIPNREMIHTQVYQSLMYYRSLDASNLDKFHTSVYFDPVPVKVDISEGCHALLTMTYPTPDSELGGFRVTVVSGNDIPGVNVIRKHIDLPFTVFLKSKEETSLKVVEFITTCVKEVDSKSPAPLYTST